jgi:hypothetical protein
MQPYAVIFSLLLLPFFKFRITKPQVYILVLTIVALILFIFSGPSFNSFRSLYNYISIFCIYYVSYKILKFELFDIKLLIKRFFYGWIIVSFLQLLINKKFLTFLISDSRTTENRGVTSLAPEPTFFAIILFFFLILFFHLNYERKKTLYFLIVFSILFSAKSSMGVLFLFFIFFYLLITKLSLKYITLSFFFIILISFITPLFVDSRIYGLISLFIENPSSLLLVDASINDRFFQIFFALKGFLDFYSLPHGFSYWNIYLASEVSKYSNYVMVDSFSVDGRIMSGYGSLFFELGFFGLFVPYVFFKHILYLYKNEIKSFFLIFLILNLLLISAIPIGFTYFGFYLGFLEYLVFQKKQNELLYS